jgi:tetratricopeptide (TPR) repeat protein
MAHVNETVWLQIGKSELKEKPRGFDCTEFSNALPGSFANLLQAPEEATQAYERALQANPNSTAAMSAIGMILKGRELYDKALEFFRAIVQIDQTNGEAWGNLGMLSSQ